MNRKRINLLVICAFCSTFMSNKVFGASNTIDISKFGMMLTSRISSSEYNIPPENEILTGSDIHIFFSKDFNNGAFSASKHVTQGDMNWARIVANTFRLAEDLGSIVKNRVLLVNAFPGYYGILIENDNLIFGKDPGEVLARFFKSLFWNQPVMNDASLDFMVALAETDNCWECVLETIHSYYFPIPVFENGTSGILKIKLDLNSSFPINMASASNQGIQLNIEEFSENILTLKYSSERGVAYGFHNIYLFSERSKFSPEAHFKVNVIPLKD